MTGWFQTEQEEPGNEAEYPNGHRGHTQNVLFVGSTPTSATIFGGLVHDGRDTWFKPMTGRVRHPYPLPFFTCQH